MKYELKSVLKNKASFVCLLVFLLINMFSMNFTDFENDVEGNIISSEQLITETQSSISQIDLIRRQSEDKITPTQNKVLNNYEKYLNWKIENANEAIEHLKKEGVKAFDNYAETQKYDLWNQAFEMDCFAKTDKQLSYVVFKDELAKLGYPKISFDPTLLNDMQEFFDRDYTDAYHHSYVKLQNAFHDIETGNDKNIINIVQGPWSYLCFQLRSGSIFSLMIIPIGLFYTLITIWQQKQSKSFELSYLNAKNKSRFLLSKVMQIGISYALIVIISLFIPMIILGLRYGFDGLDSYMLIDWNNFKSFNTNLSTHYNGWITSMFSEYLISKDDYMPLGMENISIYIPLILSFGLGAIKILFIVILGFLCSVSVKKSWISYGFGLFIVCVYMYSQQITLFPEFYPMINPFSIISSLTVIVGNGVQTSLNAILMLVVWIVILYSLTLVIFKRFDVD